MRKQHDRTSRGQVGWRGLPRRDNGVTMSPSAGWTPLDHRCRCRCRTLGLLPCCRCPPASARRPAPGGQRPVGGGLPRPAWGLLPRRTARSNLRYPCQVRCSGSWSEASRSRVAQLAERPAVNRQVTGSSPVAGAEPQVRAFVFTAKRFLINIRTMVRPPAHSGRGMLRHHRRSGGPAGISDHESPSALAVDTLTDMVDKNAGKPVPPPMLARTPAVWLGAHRHGRALIETTMLPLSP